MIDPQLPQTEDSASAFQKREPAHTDSVTDTTTDALTMVPRTDSATGPQRTGMADNEARQHVCGECRKSFLTLGGLKQHQYTHSLGEKTFQCDICPKAYTNYPNLCRHKREKHKNYSDGALKPKVPGALGSLGGPPKATPEGRPEDPPEGPPEDPPEDPPKGPQGVPPDYAAKGVPSESAGQLPNIPQNMDPKSVAENQTFLHVYNQVFFDAFKYFSLLYQSPQPMFPGGLAGLAPVPGLYPNLQSPDTLNLAQALYHGNMHSNAQQGQKQEPMSDTASDHGSDHGSDDSVESTNTGESNDMDVMDVKNFTTKHNTVGVSNPQIKTPEPFDLPLDLTVHSKARKKLIFDDSPSPKSVSKTHMVENIQELPVRAPPSITYGVTNPSVSSIMADVADYLSNLKHMRSYPFSSTFSNIPPHASTNPLPSPSSHLPQPDMKPDNPRANPALPLSQPDLNMELGRMIGRPKSRTIKIGDKKMFLCPICRKMLSRSTSFNRHIKTHTQEKPYTCRICGKAFTEKYNLTRHIKNMHNNSLADKRDIPQVDAQDDTCKVDRHVDDLDKEVDMEHDDLDPSGKSNDVTN